MRYRLVADPLVLKGYRAAITGLSVDSGSPTLRAARDELARGLRGLLGVEVPVVPAASRDGLLAAGTPTRRASGGGAPR